MTAERSFASEIDISSTANGSNDLHTIRFSALPTTRLNRYRPVVKTLRIPIATFPPPIHKLPVTSLGSQTLPVVPLAWLARTVVAWPSFGTADGTCVRGGG